MAQVAVAEAAAGAEAAAAAEDEAAMCIPHVKKEKKSPQLCMPPASRRGKSYHGLKATIQGDKRWLRGSLALAPAHVLTKGF